jgi:hypothetical protein
MSRLIGFPTSSLLIIGSPNCNRQKPALKLKKTTYYHKMNDNKNDSTIAGSMKVVVHFVEIVGIVDHHCLNYLLIIISIFQSYDI